MMKHQRIATPLFYLGMFWVILGLSACAGDGKASREKATLQEQRKEGDAEARPAASTTPAEKPWAEASASPGPTVAADSPRESNSMTGKPDEIEAASPVHEPVEPPISKPAPIQESPVETAPAAPDSRLIDWLAALENNPWPQAQAILAQTVPLLQSPSLPERLTAAQIVVHLEPPDSAHFQQAYQLLHSAPNPSAQLQFLALLAAYRQRVSQKSFWGWQTWVELHPASRSLAQVSLWEVLANQVCLQPRLSTAEIASWLPTAQALVAADPQSVSAYLLLGSLYDETGQTHEAIQTYDIGLQHFPHHPWLNTQRAIAAFRFSTTQEESQVEYWLAQSLAALEKHAEQLPAARYNLALIYAQLAQSFPEEAANLGQKAVEELRLFCGQAQHHPWSAPARALLSLLQSPVALLTRGSGEVYLQRFGEWVSPQPIAPLYPGNQLDVRSQAQATLIFIQPYRLRQISSPKRLDFTEAESRSVESDKATGMVIETPAHWLPRVLYYLSQEHPLDGQTPRYTIETTRPVFHWRGAPASAYLQVWPAEGGKKIWEKANPSAGVAYDGPALRPGQTYYWSLGPSADSPDPQQAIPFTILDPPLKNRLAQALSKIPTDEPATAHCLQGNLYLQFGLPGEAREAFAALLEIYPEDRYALAALAYTFSLLDDPPTARQYFARFKQVEQAHWGD